MQNIDMNQIMGLSGAVLPLSILLIENDEDRQFLTEQYLQYRPLMYKIASQFFSDNYAEMEDAVSSAVERLCKKCETLKQVECNKRASYIVSTVRNVCLSRLREIGRQRRNRDYAPDVEVVDSIPSSEDVQGIVFDRVFSSDLLDAFPELSKKDKDLIRFRHIDLLGYDVIAQQVGITEIAARTAVSRAKSKLERLAMNKKRVENDE
jgi:RNA polymerase sigma-70 factor (ECF subfamily)